MIGYGAGDCNGEIAACNKISLHVRLLCFWNAGFPENEHPAKPMNVLRRNLSNVAGWTLVSRVLGLARDMLLFSSLGAGLVSSAFILAFTLPNLFRRLLGEGALTSSTIPVLAATLEKDGQQAMLDLLNAVLSRLAVVLLVMQVVAVPVFILFEEQMWLHPRWQAAAELSQKLFPYMLFICLGAVICGALNVLGRFVAAALNQVWLNLAMIAAILYGMYFYGGDIWARVNLLCFAVLLGGAMQLLLPGLVLKREGWGTGDWFETHPQLDRVMGLFWPSLLGAAIFQINILVSRVLAFSLDDSATGLLYIASRLVELPLGVFAIAVTTVLFPELSRLSSLRDEEGFGRVYGRGLSLIFMIMLPAVVGLVLLAAPILSLLFEWGLFGAADVYAATPVLQVSALGLPFFAWSTLLTRAYYARQQMRVPVILAGVNLFINLILGLILMRFYGAAGLALANVLSALIHCIALQVLLPGGVLTAFCLRTVGSVVVGLAVLGVALVAVEPLLYGLPLASKLLDLLFVALGIPLAGGLYLLVLWLLRHPALRELMGTGDQSGS
jgi:putative peptidoglycan lipid II flippase